MNEGVVLNGSACESVCFGSGEDDEGLLSAEEEDKDDSLLSGLKIQGLLCSGEGVLSPVLGFWKEGLAVLSRGAGDLLLGCEFALLSSETSGCLELSPLASRSLCSGGL